MELVERVQLRDERQRFGGSAPPGVPNATLSPQSEVVVGTVALGIRGMYCECLLHDETVL